MLTLWGLVWDPNRANPLHPKWAAICAGPVSFDTTKRDSDNIFDNWKKLVGWFPSKITFASNDDASTTSPGPGAITISIFLFFFLINLINSL